jgi:subtilisin family serine protease
MSLGGNGTTGPKLQEIVFNKLDAMGVLSIAAAGNSGDTEVSYPAGFPTVMSVAAVDSNMAWATFSQFNSDVEIAGPGVGVLSTVPIGSQTGASINVGASSYSVQPMAGSPRTSATGPLADFGLGDVVTAGSMAGKVCLISRGTISFAQKVLNCQASAGIGAVIYNNAAGDLFGTLGTTVTTIPSIGALQADGATMLTQIGTATTVAVFGTDAQYASYSGTSMATPHVSGVAALVWSYFPSCTAANIRNALTATALDVGDPGRDDKTGAGVVQAKAAYDYLKANGCSGAP